MSYSSSATHDSASVYASALLSQVNRVIVDSPRSSSLIRAGLVSAIRAGPSQRDAQRHRAFPCDFVIRDDRRYFNNMHLKNGSVRAPLLASHRRTRLCDDGPLKRRPLSMKFAILLAIAIVLFSSLPLFSRRNGAEAQQIVNGRTASAGQHASVSLGKSHCASGLSAEVSASMTNGPASSAPLAVELTKKGFRAAAAPAASQQFK